jgi:AcrR family transcriptional regulator
LAQARAEGTVEELLGVAEQLFAEQGVENVALTQIVAISGQKNRSALHYHFGSRGGVLSAVMDRRLATINARRQALLEALPANASARDIVRADIEALGKVIVEEAWGADYISILAQVRFHPSLLGENLVSDDNLTGVRQARQKLRAATPQLPPELVSRRFAWMVDAVVFALARWTRDTQPAGRTHTAMARLIEELADFGTAGLLAPVTQEPDP